MAVDTTMEATRMSLLIGLIIAVASLRCVFCVGHDGCSSSYSLPTDYLGFSYEVLMWPPGGQDDSEASFSVVASSSSSSSSLTDVSVRFPPESDDCLIVFGAVRLDCGQTVDFTLLSGEVATFTSTTTDLSGTLIEASMPVAVYANNSRVMIGWSNVSDSTSEQMFPVSAWGRQFAVAPIRDNSQSGYSLRVTCGTAVNVSVNIAGVVHQLMSQRPLTVGFPDNRPAYVSVVDDSESAVQLVQFVRGATVAADSGAPAALVVPAVERFSHVYDLVAGDGYTEYVSIVTRRADISGLRLNGQPLGVSALSWLNVDSGSDWVTAAVQLPASRSSKLENTGQRQFGAYHYGYDRGRCAFAHTAGASLPIQPTVSPPMTPMSTTPRPTQPSQVGCRMDNMGTEFVLAFINNLVENGTYQLEIYPTSFSRQPSVDVRVQLAAGGWDQSLQLPSSRSVMVDVPGEVELRGTEMSRKAVIVTTASDEAVGVYAMSSAERGSCDGFVALPVISLGVDHFVLCFFPPDHQSEIGIVAVHDSTTVSVTLRQQTRPGVRVTWNKTTYTNGQTFTISMSQYDTVQLQSLNDLSGTRLTSNKPIAVFSGNNDVSDGLLPKASHLVEQLPPVDYWGYTFYLFTLPGVDSYTYMMVTAESPNDVELRTPTTTLQPQQLSHAGDFRSSSISELLVMRASSPLLVAQFGGDSAGSGPRAMMLVPPAELFRSWYTLATGHSDFDNFTHYVILVANRSAIDRLQLDGQPVGGADWVEFDATHQDDTVGRVVPVKPGVHVIVQLDGTPFGAYVYGHSESNCAYAFAAGLCLGSPNNLTTHPPVRPSAKPNTTATNEITDCTCLTVKSDRHVDYSGQFYRHSTLTFNDLPYYIRAGDGKMTSSPRDCDLFLYAFTEEASYWVVGPSLGGRQGALVGQPVWSEPYNVTSWRAFNDADGGYVDDVTTSVTCSCPALTSCKSTEMLVKAAGSSPYNGVFTLLNTSYSGRPAYQHEHHQLYLFYSEQFNCSTGAWVISDGLSSTSSTSMFAIDSAVDPVLISADTTWLVYDRTTDQFTPDSRLSLACYVSE